MKPRTFTILCDKEKYATDTEMDVAEKSLRRNKIHFGLASIPTEDGKQTLLVSLFHAPGMFAFRGLQQSIIELTATENVSASQFAKEMFDKIMAQITLKINGHNSVLIVGDLNLCNNGNFTPSFLVDNTFEEELGVHVGFNLLSGTLDVVNDAIRMFEGEIAKRPEKLVFGHKSTTNKSTTPGEIKKRAAELNGLISTPAAVIPSERTGKDEEKKTPIINNFKNDAKTSLMGMFGNLTSSSDDNADLLDESKIHKKEFEPH